MRADESTALEIMHFFVAMEMQRVSLKVSVWVPTMAKLREVKEGLQATPEEERLVASLEFRVEISIMEDMELAVVALNLVDSAMEMDLVNPAIGVTCKGP